MSLKLQAMLINVSIPRQLEELKEQIEQRNWSAAIQISAKLNANLSDVQALIDETF